jgi:glycine oxidase
MRLEENLKPAEVAIIGGGVIGLSVARALALRGVHDVLVIERGSFGCEASSAAGGMLAPQAEADSADQFFEFCRRSRDLYPQFADALREETGIDIELDQTGTIYVALTEEDEVEIRQRFRWQSAAGLPVEQLTGVEARELEPCISNRARAALRFPRDVQVENRRLVSALSEANKRLGVRLLANTNVTSITTTNKAVVAVATSAGSISTRRLVVAAGAWTAFLIPPDKASAKISIEPIRGQMVCFETNTRLTRHVIYSPRGYLVPRMDGRLLAGSTSEDVGFDKNTTSAGIHSIVSRATEISEALAGVPIVDSWAGLRPKAPDGLPVLGPCAEIDGLFYASGHYRNGILLAPITGELIAEAIVSHNTSSFIQAFAPDRFSVTGTIR